MSLPRARPGWGRGTQQVDPARGGWIFPSLGQRRLEAHPVGPLLFPTARWHATQPGQPVVSATCGPQLLC